MNFIVAKTYRVIENYNLVKEMDDKSWITSVSAQNVSKKISYDTESNHKTKNSSKLLHKKIGRMLDFIKYIFKIDVTLV